MYYRKYGFDQTKFLCPQCGILMLKDNDGVIFCEDCGQEFDFSDNLDLAHLNLEEEIYFN